MAKKFDKLLEKATDATLVEADWEMIMNCVDCVRSGEVPPKAALASVAKRYRANNPHVCHHSLLVLEALVKNCGEKCHREVATKECMEDLKHLAAESSEKVKEKVLELIQCWAHAFREKPEYKIVKDTHALMKLEGFTFPAFREADAMFVAEVAPEWVDADKCYRCKVAFTLLNRKHHCRNCGQIFCDKCSSRYIPLPHIGIEKEVRVCETCFDKILNMKPPGSGTQKSDETIPLKSESGGVDRPQPASGKGEELSREEEELQLALAISQSEAEEKERQRQRQLIQMYNGPASSGQENSSAVNGNLGYKGVMDSSTAPSSATDTSDNELSRYLNRDYWEQRRVDQKMGALRQSPTPSAPSSDTSPVLGTGDDGDAAGANPNVGESAENGINNGDGSKHEPGMNSNFVHFAQNLRTTVDAFINRIRSDQMRGRSILGDGTVQTMFMTLTNMHSQLLKHLNELDDRRGYFESLQDKLTQIQDAREAIESLRDEHEQQRRAELMERQRQRQVQMFAKLGVMRQKKHEMLEQQRLLAVQRMEEERRQMEYRKQMQQQASLMARYAGPGTPTTGAPAQYAGYAGVQQQVPASYYGPGAVPVTPNPYEMQQMAASLPSTTQNQPPPPPQPQPQPQQIPTYGGSQYQPYSQSQPHFQQSMASQVPSTFPSSQMPGQMTQPSQQAYYQQTGYPAQPQLQQQHQHQPAPAPAPYFSASPAHVAPQQAVYSTAMPAGYQSGGMGVPQYMMAPTVMSYDSQQQMQAQYQPQMHPPQQQPQQPIPEAQLISFD